MNQHFVTESQLKVTEFFPLLKERVSSKSERTGLKRAHHTTIVGVSKKPLPIELHPAVLFLFYF